MNANQRKIDYSSTTVTYIGEAVCGAETSSAVWHITKLEKNSSGAITGVKHSGGTLDQIYKWDDRADSTKIEYK